jgi:hypothetical protein
MPESLTAYLSLIGSAAVFGIAHCGNKRSGREKVLRADRYQTLGLYEARFCHRHLESALALTGKLCDQGILWQYAGRKDD